MVLILISETNNSVSLKKGTGEKVDKYIPIQIMTQTIKNKTGRNKKNISKNGTIFL